MNGIAGAPLFFAASVAADLKGDFLKHLGIYAYRYDAFCAFAIFLNPIRKRGAVGAAQGFGKWI